MEENTIPASSIFNIRLKSVLFESSNRLFGGPNAIVIVNSGPSEEEFCSISFAMIELMFDVGQADGSKCM